ncbi:MAG TPA: hypothetical protein VF767_02570 [Bryobacteraceae bacterium]
MLPFHLILLTFAAGQDPQAAPPREAALERHNLAQLLVVRRVYVDRLNGGETAAQFRDMIIGSLERSRLFAITENQERADAVLKGSAEDLVFTDSFVSNEGLNVHAGAGANNGGGPNSRNRRGVYTNAGAGETDSVHISERKHEATASVRLVNKDGDVIWSATQESMGAKFRGASADVAEKITKQLTVDFERARKAAMGNRESGQ